MDRVKGNFQEAKLDITLKAGQPLAVEKLRQAVVKAGYTPTWLRFKATGRIIRQNGSSVLKVEETDQAIELRTDEKLKTLFKTVNNNQHQLLAVTVEIPKEKAQALITAFELIQEKK